MVFFRSLLTTVFLLFIPASIDAKSIDASETYCNVINSAYYLEDAEKRLDFEKIMAYDESMFSALHGNAAGFNFSSSAFWIRFQVINSSHDTIKRLLAFEPTWLDKIDISILTPSGYVQTFYGGDRYDYSSRKFQHPRSVFELELQPGVSTLFVRLETRDPFVVVIELWEERTFFYAGDSYVAYIGVLYGVLIAMAVYNLILFFAIRDRINIFYVLYITSFLVMNFTYSGFSFPLLWPDYPEWGNWAHSIIIYLYTISGLLFTMIFLETKTRFPRMHRWVLAYVVFILIFFVLTIFTGGYAHHVITSIFFILPFALIAFILGVVSWFNGNQTARFFVLATTAGLFGATITALTVSSILPFSFFTYRAADIGYMFDAMFLSIALADRYKALKQERDTYFFNDVRQKEILKQKEAFAQTLELRVQEELLKNKKQEAIMLKQHQQALLGSMIGIIAHQLKQPLNAINIIAFNVADKYRHKELDEEAIEKFLGNIGKRTTFMAETIDDFRNFFRPDKQKKSFSLANTIAKTCALLDKQIIIKNIKVDVSCAQSIRLRNYENELQQVLLNLISNAIDVLPGQNNVASRLIINVEELDNEIVISVEDNGGGIPMESMPHMFELYYTTKGEEGTGLGLYMSKMIVTESLGGTITVSNTEVGAKFVMRLNKEE